MPDSQPDPGPGAMSRAPAVLLRLTFGLLGLASLVAGYVGLSGCIEAGHCGEVSNHPLDILYYDLQLFVLGSPPLDDGGPFPTALDVARFTAPAVTAYALVEAARALFASELRRWRTRRSRDHVIVCGDGMVASTLVRRLRTTGHRVVVIPSDAMAHELPATALADARPRRLTATSPDPEALRAAGIAHARVLYACTGDSATNTAIALAAARAVRDTPLAVYAQVDDPEFGLALQARVMGSTAPGRTQLTFFNIDDLAARRLLAEQPPVPGAHGPPRMVVLGATNFGQAVLVELARRWRRSGMQDAAPIRVALVDEAATAVAADLAYRYPFLALSCRIDPTPGGLPELLTRDNFSLPPDRVYICYDDDERALKTALIAEQVWHPAAGSIVVRLERLASLREAFTHGPEYLLDGLSGTVRPYGVVHAACDPQLIREDLIERLGRSIHQNYVLACRRNGETPETNPLLVAWDELPPAAREANRAQARDIGPKLARLGCVLYPRVGPGQEHVLGEDEVELLAAWEHERWLAERVDAGWRYAEKRDDARRLHPAVREWADLSRDMRDRNYAMRELPEILADAGFRIVRVRGDSRLVGGT